MSPRIFLSGAVLLVLAAGSWWLAESGTDEKDRIEPAAHTPDYLLERFTIITLGDNGKPKQRLSAVQMVHFPYNESTQLAKPRLVFYADAHPPWRVNSEQGRVLGDGEILLFQGQVQIDRDEAPGFHPINILTSDLEVRPEDHYAETTKDVDAKSRGDRVQARGMQVWFNKPIHIKLLTMARGYYEVN